MDIFQQIVLGIIQGIVEWLPFSSEGILLLVKNNFFEEINLDLFIRQALFLHLGTFFAALIYFRREVGSLTRNLFHYKKAAPETKKILNFLLISTLVTGIVGLAILKLIDFLSITSFPKTSTAINLGVGCLLLVTGLFQIKASSAGYRREYNLNNTDSLFLGFMQGIAALPGLSRSGLTVSSFLFRNIDETTALRLSFIMSLPVVLIGNLILNSTDFIFVKEMFWGFLFSFIFGFLTIHLLMRFSKKVKFGHFVFVFGILMILASVVNVLV